MEASILDPSTPLLASCLYPSYRPKPAPVGELEIHLLTSFSAKVRDSWSQKSLLINFSYFLVHLPLCSIGALWDRRS